MFRETSMKPSIAMTMVTLLQEHQRNSVWYGDLDLLESCASRCGLKYSHPKKMIKAILDGLDSSDYFEKRYIKSDFSGYKRQYRCFILKNNILI